MSKASEKHRNTPPAQVLSQYLHSIGGRLTPERTAVLDAVKGLRGHFSAETVRASLSADGQAPAVATVYAGLALLVECGILRTLRVDGMPTLYELNPHAHHHLVCTCCNKIKDIADDGLDALIAARRYNGFAPESTSLTIYGTCAACQRRRRRTATTNKHK